MGRMAPTVSVVIPLRRGATVAAETHARLAADEAVAEVLTVEDDGRRAERRRASVAASRRSARWCCCSTRTSCPGRRPRGGPCRAPRAPRAGPGGGRGRCRCRRRQGPTARLYADAYGKWLRDVARRPGSAAAAAVGRQRLPAARGRAAGRPRRAGDARPAPRGPRARPAAGRGRAGGRVRSGAGGRAPLRPRPGELLRRLPRGGRRGGWRCIACTPSSARSTVGAACACWRGPASRSALIAVVRLGGPLAAGRLLRRVEIARGMARGGPWLTAPR